MEFYFFFKGFVVFLKLLDLVLVLAVVAMDIYEKKNHDTRTAGIHYGNGT